MSNALPSVIPQVNARTREITTSSSFTAGLPDSVAGVRRWPWRPPCSPRSARPSTSRTMRRASSGRSRRRRPGAMRQRSCDEVDVDERDRSRRPRSGARPSVARRSASCDPCRPTTATAPRRDDAGLGTGNSDRGRGGVLTPNGSIRTRAPLPTTRSTAASRSTSSSVRFEHSASRAPQSMNTRRIASSLRPSNVLESHNPGVSGGRPRSRPRPAAPGSLGPPCSPSGRGDLALAQEPPEQLLARPVPLARGCRRAVGEEILDVALDVLPLDVQRVGRHAAVGQEGRGPSAA